MSLKVTATPGKRKLKDIVNTYHVQVMSASDKEMGRLANLGVRYTTIGWPVANPGGGYSRGSITAAEKVAERHYRWRITAVYAGVIEYGGYRGVGPKTAAHGTHTLPGGIEINEGIYVTQRPTAPLRRALSKIKLELAKTGATNIFTKAK